MIRYKWIEKEKDAQGYVTTGLREELDGQWVRYEDAKELWDKLEKIRYAVKQYIRDGINPSGPDPLTSMIGALCHINKVLEDK